MHIEEIAREVVDTAYCVPKAFGPGLLESAYTACTVHDLRKRGFRVETEVTLPVIFNGASVDAGYRLDIWVERLIIIEVKAVEQLLPIHQAQLMTYLKLTGRTLGFLISFNVELIKNGLHRVLRPFAV